MRPTLLVMAAGMGSRYGGLKQMDPVGPHGETILEYSIHDALRAGFGKLVFIVRRQFMGLFEEKVGIKYKGQIEIQYVCQEMDCCTGNFVLAGAREKPWGTGHAILCASEVIHEPFAVINADDYYGANSFQIMANYLTAENDLASADYAMVAFTLRNTLSEHGHVARGVCSHDARMFLSAIVERTKIEKTESGARYFGSDGQAASLAGDELVSMNFWGFYPSIFTHLQSHFSSFLALSGQDPKAELFIPSVIDYLINHGQARVKILPTPDSWFGVTYRPDKEIVMAGIRRLVEQGLYPEKL